MKIAPVIQRATRTEYTIPKQTTIDTTGQSSRSANHATPTNTSADYRDPDLLFSNPTTSHVTTNISVTDPISGNSTGNCKIVCNMAKRIYKTSILYLHTL